MAPCETKPKTIYDSDGTAIPAAHINGYLCDAPDVFVESRPRPLCDVPPMNFGNMPRDGGNLILSLDARSLYPGSSLADLYDPLTMPPDLVKAHAKLDALVDRAYGLSPSCTDAERVVHLFALCAEKVERLKDGEVEKSRRADPLRVMV